MNDGHRINGLESQLFQLQRQLLEDRETIRRLDEKIDQSERRLDAKVATTDKQIHAAIVFGRVLIWVALAVAGWLAKYTDVMQWINPS